MKKQLLVMAVCLVVMCGKQSLVAQTNSATQKDLMGILFGEKKASSQEDNNGERKFEFGALPYVASSPSAGVKFGAVTNVHYRMGNDPITHKSAGTVSLAYTTKKQLFFYLRNLTYFHQNKWAADLDVRYNNNNEFTHGLGGGTSQDAKQQLDYSTIRSNISLMYGILPTFYLGGGINYNRYYNIKGYDLTDTDPYYQYNASHGIGLSRSVAAGYNISALYDSRDNIINAYRGINARATYSSLMKVFGSEQAWQHLWLEFRAFRSLTEGCRHRLAFWANASMILDGDVPYMNLPASGYDLMGKSSYGYTIGRFRGDKLVFGQMEYRVGLTPNDLIGAVLFGNMTTVSKPDHTVKLFEYMEPAAGAGLRVKLNKYSRTNISIDYAIGRQSSGLYVDIAETF